MGCAWPVDVLAYRSADDYRLTRRYHKYEIEAFADVFVSLESTEDKLLAIQNQQQLTESIDEVLLYYFPYTQHF